jgi:hypothetical protein
VDPLADIIENVSWSTFVYVWGNPLSNIDPYGLTGKSTQDDYYDENGNFLYRDNQVTDNIKIINRADWNFIESTYGAQLEDRNESNLGLMEALNIHSKLVSDADISAKAWSKITTHIISSMDEVDMSRLYNSSVSVLNYHTPGVEAKYNEPTNSASLANVDPKVLRETGYIKITVYLWGGAADTELRTVSNVQNALGIHEFLGHGVMGYSDKSKTHHKAYELQMSHPSWENTTPDFQESQTEKYKQYKESEQE